MARGETNGDKSEHTARKCVTHVTLSDIWHRQRTSEETSAWKKKKLVAREVQAAFAAFNMKQIKQATAKAFWGMKPRDSSSIEYRAGSPTNTTWSPNLRRCPELELSSFVLYIWSAGPIFQIGLILGKFPRGSTFHYPRRLRIVVLRLMLMPLMLTPSHFLIREVFIRTCEAGATSLAARGQKGITISLCFGLYGALRAIGWPIADPRCLLYFRESRSAGLVMYNLISRRAACKTT